MTLAMRDVSWTSPGGWGWAFHYLSSLTQRQFSFQVQKEGNVLTSPGPSPQFFLSVHQAGGLIMHFLLYYWFLSPSCQVDT